MIKSISLLTRKAGMTHDQFVRHWVDVHAPLALAVPGLRRYVQSHIVEERTRPDIPTTAVDVDGIAELWYDDRDIPALKEDIQDKAKEMQEKATAANQLVSAGYDPDSIVDALDSGDFSLLTHSGLVSVQLQPPGKDTVTQPGVDKVSPVPTNGAQPVPA